MVTCTVVKSCDRPAVVQGEASCGGCDAADAEFAARMEAHAGVADDLDAQADELEDAPGLAAFAAGLRAQAVQRRADDSNLAEHYRKAAKQHTHPVFACEKHESKLAGA